MNGLRRWLSSHPARAVGLSILMAGLIFGAYCSFPHHYQELADLEEKVDQAITPGAPLEDVSDRLQRLGIKSGLAIPSETVSDDGQGDKFTSSKGQILLFANHQTSAWQGPCSVELRIYVLLDPHDQNYVVAKKRIRRFRLCP